MHGETEVKGSGASAAARGAPCQKCALSLRSLRCFAPHPLPHPGHPKQDTYALKFCHMFPEQSCCLPAQDAEIEEHYFNLLDAGDICAKQSSMAKDALKLVFCAACSPRQPEYNAEVGDKTYFRVCSSLVDKVQPADFDNCGMVRVAERGAPCAGDDVVVPSEQWKTNTTACGLAVEDGSSLTHYEYLSCNGTHKFLADESGAFPPFLDGQSIQIVKCDILHVSIAKSGKINLLAHLNGCCKFVVSFGRHGIAESLQECRTE